MDTPILDSMIVKKMSFSLHGVIQNIYTVLLFDKKNALQGHPQFDSRSAIETSAGLLPRPLNILIKELREIPPVCDFQKQYL